MKDSCFANIENSMLRDVLQKAVDNNLFTPNRFWAFLFPNNGLIDSIQYSSIASFFLPPDGNIKLISLDIDSGARQVLDVYMIGKGFPLKMKDVTEMETINLSGLRQNLEGIELRSSRVIAFPLLFTTLDDLKTRHIDTIIKFNYPIMSNLKDDLNFK